MPASTRIAVTGSRTFNNRGFVFAVLDREIDAHAILLVGDARGLDALARRWAEDRGRVCVRFPADWDAHGLAAGPIRNRAMLAQADRLVAFVYGNGKGTRDCIRQAEALHIPITRVP